MSDRLYVADDRVRAALPARLLLGLGLAGTLVATAALAWPDARGAGAATPAPAPVAAATVTPSDVVVVQTTYEPGQSSGWHSHPGIHAVYVLSGTLTVYGPGCTPRTYGPGESYVGGRDMHLTRNETAAPLEMVVTTVDTNRLADSATHYAPPAGCDAV